MRRHKLMTGLGAAFLAIGCTVHNGSQMESVESPPEAPAQVVDTHEDAEMPEHEEAAESSPEPRAQVEPPSQEQIDSLRPLLLARHAKDLPDRATLQAHANPEGTLMWLADHDERVVVRERALLLLGHFDSPSSQAFLVAATRDPSRDSKLQAAAVAGLANYDLEAREDLREVVASQLEHPDVRVGYAAVQALRDVPSAAAALERASNNADLAEQVRRAAQDALAHAEEHRQ
jgi:hypothetical protein